MTEPGWLGAAICLAISRDLAITRSHPNKASTLAHEVTHWTKHEQRLDRDFGRKRWGDTGYASEELVAELGSAFLCADLELHQEPREDNAAYIANWLEVLKNDNRAIFAASAYAQRAADYLNQKAAAQVAGPARLDLSFRSMTGPKWTSNAGELQRLHCLSGALLVEHRSLRANNLHQFSLRLEHDTNVLVRSRCLVPEFALQTVVIPNALHLTPKIAMAELVPRRAAA